jgi:hypothetical protein
MSTSEDLIKVTYDLEKLREKDYKSYILISSLIKELNKKSRAVRDLKPHCSAFFNIPSSYY